MPTTDPAVITLTFSGRGATLLEELAFQSNLSLADAAKSVLSHGLRRTHVGGASGIGAWRTAHAGDSLAATIDMAAPVPAEVV